MASVETNAETISDGKAYAELPQQFIKRKEHFGRVRNQQVRVSEFF
jgi:hypothetical protein